MTIEQTESGTMQVKVRVYAGLRRYLPSVPLGESVTVRLLPATAIGEVLDQLGIPRTETKTCFVNGIRQDFDYQLKEADELAAFPPIAGGFAPLALPLPEARR